MIKRIVSTVILTLSIALAVVPAAVAPVKASEKPAQAQFFCPKDSVGCGNHCCPIIDTN